MKEYYKETTINFPNIYSCKATLNGSIKYLSQLHKGNIVVSNDSIRLYIF